MRINALATRLLLLAAIWNLVVLPVAGFVLIAQYRDLVERGLDTRIDSFLTSLIAQSVNANTGAIDTRPDLGEPRFGYPFSGWYWQIARVELASAAPKMQAVMTAASLREKELALVSLSNAEPVGPLKWQGYVTGPENQRLRIIERSIDLPDGAGLTRFSFTVAVDSQEIDRDLADFSQLLAAAFVLLALGILAGVIVQVQVGLKPLRDIRSKLGDIRTGTAQALEAELPAEVKPLQDELNLLLEANRGIIERARTHVGNLAHALKTPLSVITNEASLNKGELAEKVGEQATVMRDQIAHHLSRARMVAQIGSIATVTAVEPVVAGLARTLGKIHARNGIDVGCTCPPDLRFAGERQDLEEMVGNLLDNACKFAASTVHVTVEPVTDRATPMLSVVVDDDGPGLTPAQRERVLKRGQRLDETKPGSGLGLSIVVDLADLYKGDLALEESADGGVCAILTLPAISPAKSS